MGHNLCESVLHLPLWRECDADIERRGIFDHRRKIQVQISLDFKMIELILGETLGDLNFPLTTDIVKNDRIPSFDPTDGFSRGIDGYDGFEFFILLARPVGLLDGLNHD